MTSDTTPGFGDRFRALRHPAFRLYWSGQLVSLIGTWMQSVAQGWLMHRLTASPFMLGLLSFLQFLPVLLLALWAGVVVDRMDRRRLLLITQSAFLVQATLLAAVTSAGVVQPWMVLGLAFLFGIFNAFDLPTRQSFVVEMVGREDLSNGIALNSAAFNTARIVGPAIAGILLATVGESGCFWLNALSYVAVLASLVRLRLPPRAAPASAAGDGWAFLREGVRYAWDTRSLRNLLLLLGFCAGLGFQYMVLLPVYTREILHAGPAAYGWLVSAFGLGSLTSAVLMTRRLDRWALRRYLLVGLAVSAVGMGAFAWSRWLPLSLVAGLVSGFGLILYVSSTNVLLQMTTEERFRGRVMSLYTLLFVGTAPLGALLTGTLAQHFGAPTATSVNALILAGGTLWVARRLRELSAREAGATEPPVAEKLG